VLLTQAATTTGVADVLLGLGLPGVVVLALGAVVRVLYNRATEDAAYHRQRADRLEEQVRSLESAFRVEYAGTLAKATAAVADAMATIEATRRK
jgi:hypothetical protein